jgi:stage V sporulation protein D (sporulation-specific penicillin-binding protein)
METEDASGLLEAAGFEVETRSEGILVTGQSPRPGTSLPVGGTVVIETGGPDERYPQGNVRVPDLRNLSVRRAMNRLSLHHLTLSVRGSGIIVSQSPSAGEMVKPGTTVVVRCQSRSDLAARLD